MSDTDGKVRFIMSINFKAVANAVVSGSPLIVGEKLNTEDLIGNPVTPTAADLVEMDGKEVAVLQFEEVNVAHHYFGGTLLTKMVQAWKQASEGTEWKHPSGVKLVLKAGTTKSGRKVTLVEIV